MPDYAAPGPIWPLDTFTDAPELIYGSSQVGDHEYTGTATQRVVKDKTANQLGNPANGEVVSFRHDWYYRIHATPRPLELGSVLADIEIDYLVWNAHYRDLSLNAVDGFFDAGIEIIDPVLALPALHRQFAEVRYGLLVKANEGTPTYDGQISLIYDTDRLDTQVTLVRVVLWPFEPNWKNQIRERYEWRTNVVASILGKQQRFALREVPRKQIEFSHHVTDLRRARMEALMWDRQSDSWGLPGWTDQSVLEQSASPGDRTLWFSSAGRRYSVGQSVVLLADENLFELGRITILADDRVEISSQIRLNWPRGTPVFPVLSARLVDDVQFTKVTATYHNGVVRWQLDEDHDIPAVDVTDTYRGHPLITFMPNWASQRPVEYARKVGSIEHTPTRPIFEDDWETPSVKHQFDFFLNTRAKLDWFLEFMHARRGKQKAIWIPTHSVDMRLADGITGGDTSMKILRVGFDRYMKRTHKRSHIRLVTKMADMYHFEALSVVSVDATSETLAIDFTFPKSITPAEVHHICFLDLCTMDTDSVELQWKSAIYASSTVQFSSVFDTL